MSRRSSPLSAVSVGYIEALYTQFRVDPAGLDESWRTLFGVLDLVGEANGIDVLAGVAGQRAGTESGASLAELLRSRGHLLARLNPLLTDTALSDPAALAGHGAAAPLASAQIEARYLGSLAVETAHMDDAGARNWLIEAFEAEEVGLTPDEQLDLLRDLIRTDEFERFLGRKFPTKKRFGVEGAEAIVPLLRTVLRRAAEAGVTHAVIGTMHRGRLNIGANVLGRPLAEMLAQFKGAHPFPADPARPGDVPYHLGHTGGRVLASASPLGFGADGRLPPAPAPLLGADTEAVLTGLLGLSSIQYAKLMDAGIVATASSHAEGQAR